MKPTHCPACHGDRLTLIDLRGEFWYAPFRLAKARHAACLDCGVVTTYLEHATLDALRSRLAKAARMTKTTTDEL